MIKAEDITLKKTNIEIHYEDWVDSRNENTIVILHGWGGSSQSWLEVGELLFRSGFNVIVPDLPGFGKTKLEKEFDLDEYATVIEEFIIEMGLKNVILWGHSNGGAISIKIANRGKINISRLILNNSAGIRNDSKRSLKRKILNNIAKNIKKIIKILPSPGRGGLGRGFKKIRKLFYKAIGSHDYLNAEKNPNLKQTYLNIISSDLTDEIKKIKLDTLLIWGEKDTYTPLSDGNTIRNSIKNSKMIVLKNEKHGIHLHNPELLVKTFLQNI